MGKFLDHLRKNFKIILWNENPLKDFLIKTLGKLVEKVLMEFLKEKKFLGGISEIISERISRILLHETVLKRINKLWRDSWINPRKNQKKPSEKFSDKF